MYHNMQVAMFIAAQFPIDKLRNQPRRISTDKCINCVVI